MQLLEGRVPVLKEKPLAMNELEARMLLNTAERTGTPVITLTQRAFRPDFLFARRRFATLGEPVWFCYEYHANIASSTSGWRAHREFAAGGVLLDMGYHALDVLTMWFGEMFEATGDMHYVYTSSQDEILEDIASVRLNLTESDCTGNLHILRHSDRKHENFEVHCKGGMVRVDPRNAIVTVTRRGAENQEVRRFTLDKPALNQGVLSEALNLAGRRDDWRDHLRRHVANVRLCEHIYHESTQHLWRTLNSNDTLIGEPKL
jgi:predicted dehydrogenase